MPDEFRFNVGPGRNVDVQVVPGEVKPINCFDPKSKLEISGFNFI